LHGLLACLNRCIQAHFSELLNQGDWFSEGHPPELNIARVCKGVELPVFVASLWTRDPVCAMYEFMERLNVVMVMLDQFIELHRCGPVSARCSALWSGTSCSQCVQMPEFALLGQILMLSDPQRLSLACRPLSDHSQRLEVYRLYRDDLDSAVELLSRQIEIVQENVFVTVLG
jgi:hypothetical protein